MTFTFSRLQLTPPTSLPPSELLQLGSQSGGGSLTAPELPPGVARFSTTIPRSLDEIFAVIENGQSAEVTPLEWVYCFYAKAKWDEQNPSRRESTAQAIWKVAISDQVLQSQLLWRLAVYFDKSRQDTEVLAPSLADSFPNFAHQLTHSNPSNDLVIKILQAFTSQQPHQSIAKLSFQRLQRPNILLKNAGIPGNLGVAEAALDFVVPEFARLSAPTENQAQWLLDCCNHMSAEKQLQAVETLLSKVSKEVGGSCANLVDWLKNNYGPQQSRWQELSQTARLALNNWIGALNYGYFQKLVGLLLKSNSLELKEWERNQLKSRQGFWANYSDRFRRIRILLPHSSANVVDLNHSDIATLQEDGSAPTEVCIFDFGDYFIAEFFRGPGSETRIFQVSSHPHIEQLLFGSPTLSLKQIRSQGGEIHDHKYLWQGSCERLLRERNIYPNQGTTYFKGLSQKHGEYSTLTGLPTPSAFDRQERQYKLQGWQREMKEIEAAAKQYCDNL
ncbi:EH signature domain-containing protein [[Phormidium] sp. ETS-05]|uniref:EH signature domain-containing protein n=1 Tax=[Phormidium] sp. ETS-05 TaxID=222819 RepID=UPI0018EEDA47|nr:EH signature domain-containing protein [[Phormidium] sp. ETS-05]